MIDGHNHDTPPTKAQTTVGRAYFKVQFAMLMMSCGRIDEAYRTLNDLEAILKGMVIESGGTIETSI